MAFISVWSIFKSIDSHCGKVFPGHMAQRKLVHPGINNFFSTVILGFENGLGHVGNELCTKPGMQTLTSSPDLVLGKRERFVPTFDMVFNS